jgi:hypothetical protein
MISNNLEDIKINIKLKLSALWTSTMFCYVYGDIFKLFVPDQLQNLLNGNSGVGPTTASSLLSFAVMMTVPSLMIILSLVLKPTISRWVNISVGIIFTLIMALILVTTKSSWMLFYRYFALVEIILTGSIVWLAWKWPKR